MSTLEQVKCLHAEGKSKEEIAEELGLAVKTVVNKLAMLKNMPDIINHASKPPVMEKTGVVESKDTKEVNINVDEDLTIDSLSERLGIDTDIWQATQIVGNQWGNTKQLKIKFEKQKTYILQEAVENLIKKIDDKKIVHQNRTYTTNNDTMLEISIYDHHFGKLAHKSETGNDYDLGIARDLYLEAVGTILKRASGYKLDRILFPIGQDLFHVNNEISTTEGGTFQDTDSRLSKIFETVQETLISCIDDMLRVCPVDVVYVPDNHGPLNSYFMTKVLEAYYKGNKNVSVDSSPQCRKYYRYGNTLIGMSHGHMEKADILPLTMACEAKYDWCETKFHEIHCGHFHKKAEKKYNTADSLGDVVLRYLPSLAGSDKWHVSKGFGTTRKFCECYLYDKVNGPVGSLIYNKA
jgi:hypothetical protein